MIYIIGILVGIGALLESYSYYAQIRKTLNCHQSKDVSSTSYLAKVLKYIFCIVALWLSQNWVGLGLEIWAFGLCITPTIIIIKNKPDNWSWR